MRYLVAIVKLMSVTFIDLITISIWRTIQTGKFFRNVIVRKIYYRNLKIQNHFSPKSILPESKMVKLYLSGKYLFKTFLTEKQNYQKVFFSKI